MVAGRIDGRNQFDAYYSHYHVMVGMWAMIQEKVPISEFTYMRRLWFKSTRYFAELRAISFYGVDFKRWHGGVTLRELKMESRKEQFKLLTLFLDSRVGLFRIRIMDFLESICSLKRVVIWCTFMLFTLNDAVIF